MLRYARRGLGGGSSTWALLWLTVGCAELPTDTLGGSGASDAGALGIPSACDRPITCKGETAQVCLGADEIGEIDCAAEGLTCAECFGCAVCPPRQRSCDGNRPRVCRADGSGWDIQEACDSAAGLHCDVTRGSCGKLCELAEAEASYTGCEYWPRVTPNLVDEEFTLAVAVSNEQSVPAQVVVDRGGDPEDRVIGPITVQPGEVEVIALPWHSFLRGPGTLIATKGTYRLVSNVPVTAYQFSPLEYRVEQDCEGEREEDQGDRECFSFTNDASLLLPTHVMTGDYMVIGRESLSSYRIAFYDRTGERATQQNSDELWEQSSSASGFVSIAGVEEEPVQVEITMSAHTKLMLTTNAEEQLLVEFLAPAYAPGERATFTLQRGDVLQLTSDVPDLDRACEGFTERFKQDTSPGVTFEARYCDLGPDYDLTGTRIRATGRVSVMAGHRCAFVPYYRYACDHLEESMFPLETWGHEVLVGVTKQLKQEPNVVRVVAAVDGTTVQFEPSLQAPVSLDAGEYFEFETTQDVMVRGS